MFHEDSWYESLFSNAKPKFSKKICENSTSRFLRFIYFDPKSLEKNRDKAGEMIESALNELCE